MSSQFDVAIIGGGIVGASIAYFLAPYCNVVILEMEGAAGYHSTGRSAALYAPSYGPRGIRALNRGSKRFFECPPAGFASSSLLSPRGVLYVGAQGEANALRELFERENSEQGDSKQCDVAAAVDLVPVLNSEAICGAVFDSAPSDIDVDLLLQSFLRGARSAGSTIRYNAKVTQLERRADSWRITLDSKDELTAGSIVNCAGAWVDVVAGIAGALPIGIDPRRRSAFLFPRPEGVVVSDWPAVVHVGETWYFKPDAQQLLGSPANADPTVPHDVVAEELDVATGIYEIEQVTTMTIRRPTHTWAGLRSFVADGEPVCGFDETVPGFFWAAGLGGYGIQTAPAFGELCASILLGRSLPEGLQNQGNLESWFAPSRASLSKRLGC